MGQEILHIIKSDPWLFKVVLIFIATVVGSWLIRFIQRRLAPKLPKTKFLWDRAVLKSAYAPIQTFVWVFALTLIFPVVVDRLQGYASFAAHIAVFREVAFVGALFWFSMLFIKNMEHDVNSRFESIPSKLIRDRTSIRAVAQVCRAVVVLLTILIVLQTVGVSLTSLLAFGGVGGIAIGFAAKDTISNFLGGMMIFWDRPFSVGDWVSSPDRQLEGTVENIGWRLTTIRTFDKRPLYVPNGIFSSVMLENPSRMSNRRIKTMVGLRYEDAKRIPAVTADIEKMLRAHPEIDATKVLMVNFAEFGPSSLNILIYTFTKTTEWVKFQSIQQDVFLKVLDIVDQHGAECAFPTRTIQVAEANHLQHGDRLNEFRPSRFEHGESKPEFVRDPS